MKIYNVKYVVFFCLFTFFCFFSHTHLASADNDNLSGSAGFTYKVNFPDNQIEEAGYYNLIMKTGQKQTLTIDLYNPSSKNIIVDISLNRGLTNQNGVIEYESIKSDPEKSLQYEFKDIVKGPETLKIPAKGEKKLELNVTMPNGSFDGLIAGGVRLEKKDDKKDNENIEGTTIKNKFAYLIGIVLQENSNPTTKNVTFNKAFAGSSNSINTIFINYSNTQPDFLDNVSTEVQITKKGSENVLYDAKKTNMRMAPNSNMDFPISMNGEQMVAGKYIAKGFISSDKDKWPFEQEFTITPEQADKFNSRDIGLVQKEFNWKLVILIAIIILLAIGTIFIIVKYMRNKRNPNKNKKGKRNNKSSRAR